MLGYGYHVRKTGRIAIHGRRRGEDDIGNVVLAHRPQEGNRAADIDAVVFERYLAGLADGL